MLSIFSCVDLPPISFLVTYLFKLCIYFFSESFIFLWLSCEISLYNLNISSLADLCSASIFSMWLIFSFSEERLSKSKSLILMKSTYSFFSFMIHAFCTLPKKLMPNPRTQRLFFSYAFFLQFYSFSSYILVYD